MAFFIPSGLHAKQLVDFCTMEFASSAATHSATMPVDRVVPDHSCCENGNKPATDDRSHHDCDWAYICACSIGQSQLGDKDWVPTYKDAEIIHQESEKLTPFFTFSHEIFDDRQPRIGEYSPPLWLFYDTL
ncbi:MAG: hypothetical protein ACNA8K_14935 [Cyclonatronaceae bacterium]